MDFESFTRLLPYLGWGWLLAAAVMLGVWFVELARRDATIVDVAWTINLGLLAALYAVLTAVDANANGAIDSSGSHARRIALVVLVGAWSARLATHLVTDRVLGKPEDGRYRLLRERWGPRAHRNFLAFFQAQALLDAVLSIPFVLVAANPSREIATIEWIAVLVWTIAITGESIADRQLARFRRDPASKGRTCRVGLWNHSRHPNYFFEWLHWIAYALAASAAPLGWIAWSAPAIMLFLLFAVTGIPATEAHALASRGQDYADYQRTTSAFVPWFKKGT